MFRIKYTNSAIQDLRCLRKFEQKRIMDVADNQLQWEPLTETRHRKQLRPNDLSGWELKIGKNRIFYDVDTEAGSVEIRAVGQKEHNRLFIRGKEFRL